MKRFKHVTMRDSRLFLPSSYYTLWFNDAVKRGLYHGRKFQPWNHARTAAKARIGKLQATGEVALQSILIPIGTKPGAIMKHPPYHKHHVSMSRAVRHAVRSEQFERVYKQRAAAKRHAKGFEYITEIPDQIVDYMRVVAANAKVEQVAGFKFKRSGGKTMLREAVVVNGQEFEADTDKVFNFEMLFHNHVNSKDPEQINFVPSPDDFMNTTANKPHVIAFKDKRSGRVRFILLRSLREATPTETFFNEKLRNLAIEINETINVHQAPKAFIKAYQKRLNDLGFDFKYFDPNDEIDVVYRKKKH